MSQAAKKTSSSNPFTENWVKIRSIENGMIVLPDKTLVSGVKIEPRNIFILEKNQQDSIINALKNCYNTLNFEFWLISADRPVDISAYISHLETAEQQQQNPARKKIISQDIDKCYMFINNQVVDTEYYILFKEKNMEQVSQKVRALINGFASCSLNASMTTDDDLRVIIDNFLNGGVRTNFGTVVVK